jgi:uncharacterized membrane protein HdeD (DUF308 family)
MSSGFPYFMAADTESIKEMRQKSTSILLLGIVMIIGGIFAISCPHTMSLTTVLVFGWILIIEGIIQAVSAFWAKAWGGFFLQVLTGLMAFFVGIVFIDRPGLTVAVWTLVLAIYFVASGLSRVVVSLALRYSSWGWGVLNGIVTFLLGVLIWKGYPYDSLWVIGLLVGIELIFSGWSWVMLAMALRNIPEPPAPAPVTPAPSV